MSFPDPIVLFLCPPQNLCATHVVAGEPSRRCRRQPVLTTVCLYYLAFLVVQES